MCRPRNLTIEPVASEADLRALAKLIDGTFYPPSVVEMPVRHTAAICAKCGVRSDAHAQFGCKRWAA